MSDLVRVTQVVRLPARRGDSNKGSYGHVLVVGGSMGMAGAVSLATNAALRGGAGLVTFAAPATIQPTIVPLAPCALSLPLECDNRGQLAAGAVRQMLSAVKYTVLAVGPGMGRGSAQQNLVRAALGQDKPVVLDADGLNNLAGIDGWPADRRCPLVLTPHPGELSRLLGKETKAIQAERENTAVQAVRTWSRDADVAAAPSKAKPQAADRPLVLVLKGQGTVVTDGRRVYVNDTGNPGMASGGTGDVLTGLTAALIAQGLEPFDAACLAVWVHGRAGDLAAAKYGQVSLIATDLLEFLPEALKSVGG